MLYEIDKFIYCSMFPVDIPPLRVRRPCRVCAFLARAKSVITVRFVGFMQDRGPSNGLFLFKFPPPIRIRYEY